MSTLDRYEPRVPPTHGHVVRLDEFREMITLADDSLRSHWNEVSSNASLLDMQ
jgi:hypothetical protein